MSRRLIIGLLIILVLMAYTNQPSYSEDFIEVVKVLEIPEPPSIICEVPLSEDLQQYTYDTCADYNIRQHYKLIMAVMWQESNFNPSAISSTSDYGIMQINKCNHKWLSSSLGVDNFLDPKQNIECGIYMMSRLLLKYQDVSKALMAYNLGEGGAAKLWKQNIYSTRYSRAILDKQNLIKQEDI